MKTIIALMILVGMLSVGSYATSVSVTSVNVQQRAGVLTYIYFETSNAGSSASPSVDTSLVAPSGTGSYAISRGSTVNLWSTPFTSSTSIPAGYWNIDLWASTTKATGLTVSIVVTNSAGTTTGTVLSSGTTTNVGTAKGQVFTRFSGAAVAIPAGGYIDVKLTAPSGASNPASFTVYWGKAQLTDFQVMMSVESS
jgi:hypothetical protein